MVSAIGASTRSTRRGERSATHTVAGQQQRGQRQRPQHAFAVRGDQRFGRLLEVEQLRAVRRARRARPRPGSCSPLSDTSAVAWPSRSQQQAVDAGRQRRAGEVARRQRRRAARAFDIGEEGGERIGCGTALAATAASSAACSVARRGSCAWRARCVRGAGQVARGEVEAGERAVARAACSQRRPQAFAAPAARLRHRAPSSAIT